MQRKRKTFASENFEIIESTIEPFLKKINKINEFKSQRMDASPLHVDTNFLQFVSKYSVNEYPNVWTSVMKLKKLKNSKHFDVFDEIREEEGDEEGVEVPSKNMIGLDVLPKHSHPDVNLFDYYGTVTNLLFDFILCNEEKTQSVFKNIETRPYQQEAVNRALHQNLIVSYPTGSGKTMIAIMLMMMMLRSIPLADKIIIFLCTTTELVKQQMGVIFRCLADIDAPTGMVTCLVGKDSGIVPTEYHLNDLKVDWQNPKYWMELGEALLMYQSNLLETNNLPWPPDIAMRAAYYRDELLTPTRFTRNSMNTSNDEEDDIVWPRIFVMTPQLLLHYLSHGMIKMSRVGLLIFDEAHHYSDASSNHGYGVIMRNFYNGCKSPPRILALTASPINMRHDEARNQTKFIDDAVGMLQCRYDCALLIGDVRLSSNTLNPIERYCYYDAHETSHNTSTNYKQKCSECRFTKFDLQSIFDKTEEQFEAIHYYHLIQRDVEAFQNTHQLPPLILTFDKCSDAASMNMQEATVLWGLLKQNLGRVLQELGFWFLVSCINLLQTHYERFLLLHYEDLKENTTEDVEAPSEIPDDHCCNTIYMARLRLLISEFFTCLSNTAFDDIRDCTAQLFDDFESHIIYLKSHPIVSNKVLTILGRVEVELQRFMKEEVSSSSHNLQGQSKHWLTKKLNNIRSSKMKSDLRGIVFCKYRLDAYLLSSYMEYSKACKSKWVTSTSGCPTGKLFGLRMHVNTREGAIRLLNNSSCSSYINLLFCSDLLGEGIDIRHCNCVISLHHPETLREYIQIKGRIRVSDGIFYMMRERHSEDAQQLKRIVNPVWCNIERDVMQHLLNKGTMSTATGCTLIEGKQRLETPNDRNTQIGLYTSAAYIPLEMAWETLQRCVDSESTVPATWSLITRDGTPYINLTVPPLKGHRATKLEEPLSISNELNTSRSIVLRQLSLKAIEALKSEGVLDEFLLTPQIDRVQHRRLRSTVERSDSECLWRELPQCFLTPYTTHQQTVKLYVHRVWNTWKYGEGETSFYETAGLFGYWKGWTDMVTLSDASKAKMRAATQHLCASNADTPSRVLQPLAILLATPLPQNIQFYKAAEGPSNGVLLVEIEYYECIELPTNFVERIKERVQHNILFRMLATSNFDASFIRNEMLYKAYRASMDGNLEDDVFKYFREMNAKIEYLGAPWFLVVPFAGNGRQLDWSYYIDLFELQHFTKSGQRHEGGLLLKLKTSPSLMELHDTPSLHNYVKLLCEYKEVDYMSSIEDTEYSPHNLQKVNASSNDVYNDLKINKKIFKLLAGRGSESPLLRMTHDEGRFFRYHVLQEIVETNVEDVVIEVNGSNQSLTRIYDTRFGRICTESCVDETTGRRSGNCFVVRGKMFRQGTRRLMLFEKAKPGWRLSLHAPEFVQLLPITEPIAKQVGELAATIREIEIQAKQLECMKRITSDLSPFRKNGIFSIDYQLLRAALTTTNARNTFDVNSMFEVNWHNQRIEFLGDAILKYVMSCWLFFNCEEGTEEELTTRRTRWISNATLAECSKKLRMHAYLHSLQFTSSGETLMDLREQHISSKMLADIMESLIGAIYLSNNAANTNLHQRIGETNGVQNVTIFCDKYIRSIVEQNEVDEEDSYASIYDTFEFILNKNLMDVQQTIDEEGDAGCKPNTILCTLLHTQSIELPTTVQIINTQFIKLWIPEERTYKIPQKLITIARNRKSSLTETYERLEYIGDAVLSALITDWLYRSHPTVREGPLSEIRSVLQSNQYFSRKLLRRCIAAGVEASSFVVDLMPPPVGVSSNIYLKERIDRAQQILKDVKVEDDFIGAFNVNNDENVERKTIQHRASMLSVVEALDKPEEVEEGGVIEEGGEAIAETENVYRNSKLLSDVYEATIAALWISFNFNLQEVWQIVSEDFEISAISIQNFLSNF